jgi:Fe-S-cluster formation regulator IscX/YfhJ
LLSAALPDAAESDELAAQLEADFLDLDPAHLFYDQLRQIGLALHEIRAEELGEELLEEILTAGDQLLNVLARARRRQQARGKLTI